MITTNIIDRRVNRNGKTKHFFNDPYFQFIYILIFQTLTFILFAFLANLSVAQRLVVGQKLRRGQKSPKNIHKISVFQCQKSI